MKYKGKDYPDYLKEGNACQYIIPIAKQFCKGEGIDIGCGKWPFPGALPYDLILDNDAYDLPDKQFDYIFSSHCLEHLEEPYEALKHWKTRLKGGVLFLYLPHPHMEYWKPENCKKHLSSWHPKEMVNILKDMGFSNILFSERDLNWSFSVVCHG